MNNPDRKYRDNSGREYKTAPADTHHAIPSPPPPVEIKIEKMDGDDPVLVKVIPSPPTNSATSATFAARRITPDVVVIGVKPSPPTTKQPVKNKKKLQSKKSKDRAERRANRERIKRKLEFENEVASNATEVTSNKKKSDKEVAAKKPRIAIKTTITLFYKRKTSFNLIMWKLKES